MSIDSIERPRIVSIKYPVGGHAALESRVASLAEQLHGRVIRVAVSPEAPAVEEYLLEGEESAADFTLACEALLNQWIAEDHAGGYRSSQFEISSRPVSADDPVP